MDLQYLAYLRQERNQFVQRTSERFNLNSEQKVILETFLIAFDSVMHKYIEQKELIEFAERVQNVRAAQSKYYASRTQTNLDASKRLEKGIDKEIKDMMIKAKRRNLVEVKQASMFDVTDQAQRV